MQYTELKSKIEEQIAELAKSIEKFCVLENKEYVNGYKSKLWELHNLMEDLD